MRQLRALGVRRFSSLPYAHRPGIATYLNEWSADFAATVPECLSSATFYPEEGVAGYVAERVAAGTPVVVHASGGPVGNDHTGPGPMRALMERHPTLTAVVAHLGAPEYDGFVAIAEDFERVHLDTTMAFTDFFEEMAAFPRDQLSRLVALGDRVLLGSDFPNLPYP